MVFKILQWKHITYKSENFLPNLFSAHPLKKDIPSQNWGPRIEGIIRNEGKIVIGKHSFYIRGLENVRGSNLCYVNAVIQMLITCQPLMSILSMAGTGDALRSQTMALKEVCTQFHKPDLNATNPSGRQAPEYGANCNTAGLPFSVMTQQFESVVRGWQSKRNAQQDASEFLLYLLSKIHEESCWKLQEGDESIRENYENNDKDTAGENNDDGEWEEMGKGGKKVEKRHITEDSVIMRIFSHILESRTVSKKSSGTVSMEPFFILNLSMEMGKSMSMASNAASPTSNTAAVVNGASPTANAQAGTSQILTSGMLNLEDMVNTQCKEESTDSGYTHYHTVTRWPAYLVIVLKRFSYNHETGATRKITRNVTFSENLTILDKNISYKLTSCISHQGDRADSGHYVAYGRHNADWWRYDDCKVQSVSDMGQTLMDANLQSQVYIFLYERTTNPIVNIKP